MHSFMHYIREISWRKKTATPSTIITYYSYSFYNYIKRNIINVTIYLYLPAYSLCTMGGKLPSLDMLISEMVIPLQNSYYHSDYPKACSGLYGLSMFLKGFNQGIEDMPPPPEVKNGNGLHLRMKDQIPTLYISECKRYYEKWYPLVLQRLGLYQKTVLEIIQRSSFGVGGGYFDQS